MRSVILIIVISLPFLLVACIPPQSVQNQNTAKSSKIQQVSSGWSLEVSMFSWTQENTATSPLSSGAIKYEVINGITVPPEPDATLNNSTIAWVDVNNNGVRDDVERIMAKISKNSDEYNQAIVYGRAYQKMVISNISTREEWINLYKATICDKNEMPWNIPKKLGWYYSTSITNIIFNNNDRKAVLQHIDVIVWWIDGDELACNK